MDSYWIFLAAAGGLSSNLFNFLSRYVLRENGDATSWAWFYETLRLPFFLIIAIFNFYIEINHQSLLILLSLGVTEFISVYFYMKMHQYSELSISTILSRTRLIWIPIIAFLFIGEHLKPLDYMGILLLFLGVSVAVSPHKLFIDKGAVYANLAAFFIAINVILLKLATPYASPAVILFLYSLPSAVLFPLLMKNSRERILASSRQKILPKVIAMIASAGAGYFLILALKTGDVSKVNAVYQGMMITGVIAGIVILKERKDILKKLVGTALALGGVILVTA